jgi:hypothetical protein
VRVVVVANRPGGSGLPDGLGQPLLQPGIDLSVKVVPLDNVEAGDDAHVHCPDDQRRRRRDTDCMADIRFAPLRESLHAATNR